MKFNIYEKDIPFGSGANDALSSFGGVLSPPTPASSAFRLVDPIECDFSMTGGRIGFEGIVGVDFRCVLLAGEMGDASGVGLVIES